MPYLTLMYGTKVIDQFAVEYGIPLSIGRKDDNNIVINNLAVSGKHARVEYNDEGIFVIDLESKNGTFVNGKTTLKSLLKEGDEIVIGKHTMLFSQADGGKRVAPPAATPLTPNGTGLDETMVLDTNKHRDMISSILSGATGQTVRKKAPIPVLMYLKGGEGKVVLSNKFTRIGKEPSNDIVVGGLFTGKRAATVTKRDDGYYISHMKGFARTKVNGKKIKTVVKLNHGDIVSLASLKMRFLSKAKKKTPKK